MKILYQLTIALSLSCASPVTAMFGLGLCVEKPVRDIDKQLIEHIRNDALSTDQRLALVLTCLNQGAQTDVNWVHPQEEVSVGSRTALEWLVIANRPELVPVLVNSNTDKRSLADAFNLAVSSSNNNYFNEIFHRPVTSLEALVRAFILAGADVNGGGYWIKPIRNVKDAKVAAILIESGANVNDVFNNQTPIYEAIQDAFVPNKFLDFEFIRTLIDHGALLEVSGAKSTLELARQYDAKRCDDIGYRPLTKWLLARVEERDRNTYERLHDTIQTMPIDLVSLMQNYLGFQAARNRQNGVGFDAQQALENFKNLFENLKNLHANQSGNNDARASTVTRLRSLRRMVNRFWHRIPQNNFSVWNDLLSNMDRFWFVNNMGSK